MEETTGRGRISKKAAGRGLYGRQYAGQVGTIEERKDFGGVPLVRVTFSDDESLWFYKEEVEEG